MARDDRSHEFTGVLGFFIAVCTVLVLLRCYCKIVIVKNFAVDDYLSVLALVSFLVYSSLALMGIQNGTGKRRYLIPDEKYPNGMKFRGGHGKCMKSEIIVGSFYGYSALSCVSDWIFSIVPIFIVQGLQMDRRKKISVAIILAFCALGSTATIIRIPFIKGLKDSNDFLYSTTDVAIWSTCETGIGLATSAAATLRPLLRKVFGDLSVADTSTRKKSRDWTGRYPSRSGYLTQPSQGDDNDIALEDRAFTRIHIGSGGDLSPSNSTAGLTDWEREKDPAEKNVTELIPTNGGIMKTVKITQS
ncbi:uncharacterized protein N0V89_001805 [Didymosphaeria variabile]|uniref:Rhodopsin domain-containing protein n=1 Tax=Didymosphaeria variabile TaxID=1932322 RepID=A0A9W9CDS3_9PLEO|nr:uncharacterized protein N0V89_001805 [Didymosphaeria variabile]KAJ4357230.1 hypothetical protein N0V89_001805 [Didymosphaeria variabile]